MLNLKEIRQEAGKLLKSADNLEKLEKVRLKFLGRKGELTIFLKSLKDLSLKERKKVGPQAQTIKREFLGAIKDKEAELKDRRVKRRLDREKIDVSRPGLRPLRGSLHPLTQVEREIVSIFHRLGFGVAEGPDIETEYYNFDALNIPANHPARDMWDTFWLRDSQKETRNKKQETKWLLRTHTSPVQIRYMEKVKPPFKIVAPGTTFRYEAIDATHNIQFLQLEGLLVDKKVSIANFKSVIDDFFSNFFARSGKKADIKTRLRPSYFPFTEPSFEIDVFYNGKWLEMMGAGMVHPNVYKNAGLNPKDWQGFAFGMGIDRLAMVKYGIKDIRYFYQNDIRFLRQF